MSGQYRAPDQVEPAVSQSSAPFPSFRARSTSSSTLHPNSSAAATSGGGGITSPAWLNALSDGLSWIETSKAAEKAAKGAVGIAGIGMGVGESIRDGLSARLTAAGGGDGNGLTRRPLSFTGWGGQLPGAGSTGRSSIDESNQPGTSEFFTNDSAIETSLSNRNSDEHEPHPQSQNLRHRPSSFLEYIRPSPPTPPPKKESISKSGRGPQMGPEEQDAQTSSSAVVSNPPLAVPKSSPPIDDTGVLRTPSQRRRLGPPQPANMSRLGSTQSTESERSTAANSTTVTGQRFLRNAVHKSSFSGSSVPAPATGLASLPRSASSSTYSLHEQTKPTAEGQGGAGLARSGSSGLNVRPPSIHPVSSGTSTPVNRQASQRSRSHSLMQVQTLQRSQSGHQLIPGPTPYRPGFQPAGVRTYRTEEFLEARNRKIMEISREEGRLGRRWGKLIDLHFNPSTLLDSPIGNTEDAADPDKVVHPGRLPRSSSTKSNLSLSSLSSPRRSFLSMDALSSQLDSIKPRDVWRGIRNVSGVGVEQVAAEKKREAEMTIVKWEEDKDVKRCRICLSSFSLSNRKHHCRLCGRIICSLPPTSPNFLPQTQSVSSTKLTDDGSSVNGSGDRNLLNPNTGLPIGMRRDKCSLLLVADWKTGKGQEVEEGFVGWLKVDNNNLPPVSRGGTEKGINGKSSSGSVGQDEVHEVMIKGVRVCRECWQIVSRKQQIQDRHRITGFTRLYEALKAVETEIENYLPEFREMIIQLQSDHFPPREITPETLSLHKQLVALFQDYEALTKRIRDQPCGSDENGETQWRLQQGIARAAGLFIAKEAGIIQMLPRIQRQRFKRPASSIASISSTPALSDEGSGRPMSPLANKGSSGRAEADENVAMMLQPLLEQEAQIEEYIREANAQRKFDDARTLKTSLDEIRDEIARLSGMS